MGNCVTKANNSSVKNKENTPLRSCVNINLEDKSKIFNDTNCPIDNEKI